MALTQCHIGRYWQIFANEAAASPFPETGYEPELILDVPINKNMLDSSLEFAGHRLNRQSNGRTHVLFTT